MERNVSPEDGPVAIDIDGAREVHIEVVAGEVSVGATASPARLEVTCLSGQPVNVVLDDGVLIVRQAPPGLSMRDRATVVATVPPGTPVRARTISAGALLAGLGAQCRVRTVSGEVTGSFLSGDVDVATVSGDVAIEGISGTLRASTASGDVTVAGASLQGLAARSLAGDLTVDLDPKPGGRFECRTLSGAVSFRLPAEADLDLEVATLSGRLEADGEQPAGRPRRRRWRLGGGGAALEIRTLSGPVVVRRRQAVAV